MPDAQSQTVVDFGAGCVAIGRIVWITICWPGIAKALDRALVIGVEKVLSIVVVTIGARQHCTCNRVNCRAPVMLLTKLTPLLTKLNHDFISNEQ
jgi:hypothetical protein